MKRKKNRRISRLIVLTMLFLGSICTLQAQTKLLSGTIVDEQKEPVIGATVVVKGTNKGTTSDIDGNFSIEATKGSTLVITLLGYVTQEVLVKDDQKLNIQLRENNKLLDEVVVIGYGTRAKGALTGSVTKVGGEVFESRPISNTLDALQGAMPGVTITRGSGQPGGENFSMQIRGNSSINGNKPLVLIDGVPGDMNMLNPNDIADVTVLKDAAASIYGARAADGVLMVTTKKGKSGKISVLYSFNLGIKNPHFLKKMANTRQLAEMFDEGMRNMGQPGLSQEIFDKIDAGAAPNPKEGWMKYLENYPGFFGNTDWNKEIYGNSIQQMHNLSISGGGDNNSFLVSAGYDKNTGTFNYGENFSERYNLRLNYDFNLFRRVKFETRTTFDHQNVVEPSMLWGALSSVPRVWSYLPVRTPGGNFYKYQGYQNPASSLEEGGTSKSKFSKLITNFKGTVDIVDGLKLVGQASVDLSFWRKNSIYRTFPAFNWDDKIQEYYNKPNSAGYENSYSVFNTYTSYADYNKTFSKHGINLMAGGSHERYDTEKQDVWGRNFTNNYLFTLNLADKTKLEYTKDFGGSASDNAITSFFGRLGYNYNHRVFADLTIRKDGSSKFASTKRWSAVYPAVSVGWNISEESFLKNTKIFDNLKLRTSWGKSGNQEINFGNYDFIPLVYIYGNDIKNPTNGLYPFGNPNVGYQGAESGIASANRSWETIETSNVGIDFSFLKSRLNGSFDYFVKKNNNMLVRVERPAVFGGDAPTSNDGKLETKGWEIQLNWKDKIGDLRYSITAMLSDSKNKLVSLKGTDSYHEGVVWTREGYSLNSIFGYQFDGIIQNQQQLDEYKKLEGVPANIGIGDAMYKDLDGDGKITAYGDPEKGTTGDMKYLGNKSPRYTYSSNIELSYKGFDFLMLWQGVGQRSTIRTGDFAQPYYWVWYQPMEYFYGKNWTEDNPDAKYPRIVPGGIGYDNLRDWNGRVSSNRMEDVSYLRLKILTLGYTLPKMITQKIGADNVRVYFSGKDLLTFSKGTWNNSYDPEEENDGSDNWFAEAKYPFYKVISFGVDIRF